MRMTKRYSTLASSLLAVLLLPASAAAQSGRGGQVEVGAYGSFATYDNTALALRRQFGVGGRYGIFLSRVFAIEANGDYTVTRLAASPTPVNVARVGGTLLANARLGGFGSVYLGAGYERLFYRGGLAFDDDGFHAVVGDRLSLGGRTALRLEARASYVPTTNAPGITGKALNIGATAGISVFAFGGAPRDADKDGVGDKSDSCTDTPAGAQVDAAGCPGDGDADRVLNGLDLCPDTPAGATVDGGGCPSDGDADRVFDGIDVCPETPAGAAVDSNGCPVDSDGDRVFDGLDQCPLTPAGALVDASGCPLDADGDRVFDGLDQCPDTPAATEADARGCAVVRDTDGDGVGDPSDRCAGTRPGTRVDVAGCPADPDGDGVDSVVDRCPSTVAGTRVDAVGCPILFEVVEGRTRPVVLKGVTFQSGRSVLTQASFGVLDEVAESLVANPEVRIEIAGHTDSTGVRQRNLTLSLARAQAVRAYLGSKGVAPNRMVARGFGPDRPLASNRTAAGRAQNRRVELNLLQEP